MIDRRLFIGTLTAVLIPATSVLGAVSTPQDTLIAVVRSPDCGCCGAWIDHLRQSGFIVEETLSDDVEAFKEIDSRGIKQYIQQVPSTASSDLMGALKDKGLL